MSADLRSGPSTPDWRELVRARLGDATGRGSGTARDPERLEEIVEEIAQHLEDDYREAIADGLRPGDAERRVIRSQADWSGLATAIRASRLGTPQSRFERMRETVVQEIRFAARSLAARPLFTLSVVLLLALGIGANTALFTVVNGVLLRPLPYTDPDSLITVTEANRRNGGELDPSNIKAANLLDLQRRMQQLSGVAGYWQGPATLTGGDQAELVAVVHTTHELFAVLGADAAIGSTFPARSLEAAHTAVLDHGFWQRSFAGDASVVGDAVLLDNEPYTIVGVMPADFIFLERADAYIVGARPVPEPPIDLGDEYENDRSTGYMTAIGRLRPGGSFEAAVADLERIGEALAREFPDDQATRTFIAEPLGESLTGPVQGPLLLLLGAVGLVLLIACANVANLLLARASGRQREIAVRTALGASRGRVVGQLLTESLALATTGGLVGVGLALATTSWVRAFVPDSLPRAAEIGVDATVLAFTAAISVVTGLVFGIAPAVQVAATDVQSVIRGAGRGASAAASRVHLRAGLVVAEIALALILLIGAGLTLRSLFELQSRSPGFDAERVLTLRLSLPQSKYDADEKITAFYWRLVDEVGGLPGVESAAAVLGLPFSGTVANFEYFVRGEEPPADGQGYGATFQAISPGYFETLGIPLLAGRDVNRTDTADAPVVAVINDVVARRHFPDIDPTTQALQVDPGPDATPIRIVGVVGSTRHLGYEAEPGPEIYLSFEQMTFPFTSLAVRAAGDPELLIDSVRSKVTEIDADQPVYRVETLEALMSDTIAQPRFNTRLLTAFAAVAMLLAAIGVFSVISYSVAQRTRELGVRMALGASSARVMSMVLRQCGLLIGAGLTVGIVGALIVARLAANMWGGIGASDPLVFIVVPLTLAGVGLLASWLPARRATRIDPLVALRHD